MKMRELSVSEVNQVSGASARLDWTRPDCLDIINAGFDKLQKAAALLDNTRDWRYVAATHDALKNDLSDFVVFIGGGGQATLASWAKMYA
ncbi:hypothetical protein ACFL9S_20895 [Erwinia sp. AnSW2-5]|uniref:hypothetical protein n=1 Tax=Erwinia sp. AnSW2-5 TaxID=3367692 RepID=UPI00385E3F6A